MTRIVIHNHNNRGGRFPHFLHLLLTLLTFGLWFPIWVLHRLFWRP